MATGDLAPGLGLVYILYICAGLIDTLFSISSVFIMVMTVWAREAMLTGLFSEGAVSVLLVTMILMPVLKVATFGYLHGRFKTRPRRLAHKYTYIGVIYFGILVQGSAMCAIDLGISVVVPIAVSLVYNFGCIMVFWGYVYGDAHIASGNGEGETEPHV